MTESLPLGSSESELFEAAVRAYPSASAALDELCRHGIDRDTFLNLLTFSASILTPEVNNRQPSWEIPGMPGRRILKLADRLEGLADELQRIDSHAFIKNTYGLLPVVEEKELNRLPDVMRERAWVLRLQVGVSHLMNSRIERGLEKRAKLNLIEYVQQSNAKRRPMYAEVALLLTAALYVFGRHEEITPESLKTLNYEDRLSGTLEILT
jgi:hypothetical protein